MPGRRVARGAAGSFDPLSRTRRLIDVETHQAVCTWVLQRLADAHLVEGHTIGIDATTLDANAARRSIVRRDTGAPYEAWLTRRADASGIATPTRAELARFDRTRKKKGSNADWTHPHDPDAKITQMKDGRTHLAHTAEHAVDLETGAIVGVTVQDADAGDTTTMVETLIAAADHVAAVDGASGIAEVVGDTGYHSNETLVGLADLGVRSSVSEPDRGRRTWKGKAAAKEGGLCQPAADSRPAWTTPAAAARRTAGTAQRASLRDRGHAPGASARPSQYPQTPARARLWLQPRVAHAAADWRRDAAEPPGPRGGPSGCRDRPPGRALRARGTILGPGAPKSAGFVRGGDRRQVNTNTRSSIYEEPFCHGLIGLIVKLSHCRIPSQRETGSRREFLDPALRPGKLLIHPAVTYPFAFLRFAQYAFIRLPMAAFSAAVHWWRFPFGALAFALAAAFGCAGVALATFLRRFLG